MENQKRQRNSKLRQARLGQFWTLNEAAKSIDVHITTYQRWERYEQSPSLLSLAKLCKIFGKAPEELGYGDIIGSEDIPSHVLPETNGNTSIPFYPPPPRVQEEVSPIFTLPPTTSFEQTHQQLLALARELFPKSHPPRINKFQDTQETLHVFCDVQVDKSTIIAIKKEFRRRSGWTIGIQRST